MNKKVILSCLLVLMFIGVVSFVSASEMGAISGKVLPIDSDATVYAFDLTKKIAGFATINSSGEYSIPLPFGLYNLQIAAQDYINRTMIHIGVNENEIREMQDIILAKIGETGSISGYVNPIVEGITVQIRKIGSTEFSGSSIVDSKGRYEITGLEPYTYGLSVYFNSSLSSQNFSNYKWAMIDIAANSSLSLNLTFTPKNITCTVDRIWIEFADELSGSENKKREIIASYNCKIMRHSSSGMDYTINIPPDKTVNETISLFKTNPNIVFAEPLCKVWSSGVIVSEEQEPEQNNTQVKYDQEILNAFENQTWVRVIVDLKDNSNITITGTKEERRELLKQKDEWFKPIIDEVLATLSEDEFGYKGKLSDGFGGSITKRGFDKLTNDSRIDAIYLDTPVYSTDSDNESIIKRGLGDEITDGESGKSKEFLLKEKSLFQKIIRFIKSLFWI